MCDIKKASQSDRDVDSPISKTFALQQKTDVEPIAI